MAPGAGLMLNVPTPPGSGNASCLTAACWWCWCLLSALDGGGGGGSGAPGFSNGWRKSCVFKKKP
uniref:Uncharacterized protein n=2 Tax=Arundo donax TaxID=35708 RepID=A0A0A9D8H3_ARUDO